MRISLVLQYYHPYVGGLETLFQNLAEGLAFRGHIVRVITANVESAPSREYFNGVHIERVSTPSWADRHFFILRAIRHARDAARQSDIVHTTPYGGSIPAFVGAMLAGKPVVFTALEVLGRRWYLVEPNRAKALANQLFERAIYGLPYRRFAAISKATLDDALALGMDATSGEVIHCGVDGAFSPAPKSGLLRSRLGLPSNSFVYVYFGRPGLTKGVDVLLKAAPHIQRALPRAQLVLLLADRPHSQYAAMRRLADSMRTTACIHFLPSAPRSELAPLLHDADCVVVPSLTEGFGLTTAESCALDIPVVATRVGSIPEVISGRHVLVKPGSPEQIADGVLRVSRGEWDQTPRKSFAWESMVDAYERLYRETIG